MRDPADRSWLIKEIKSSIAYRREDLAYWRQVLNGRPHPSVRKFLETQRIPHLERLIRRFQRQLVLESLRQTLRFIGRLIGRVVGREAADVSASRRAGSEDPSQLPVAAVDMEDIQRQTIVRARFGAQVRLRVVHVEIEPNHTPRSEAGWGTRPTPLHSSGD